MSKDFAHILPESRLGQSHPSKASFLSAAYGLNGGGGSVRKTKEYTLVVVTQSSKRRILLGLKHRGFGTGFYNSFGGKMDSTIDESYAHGAVRELQEETNVSVPLEIMNDGHVGQLRFTFEEEHSEEMIVHLFRIDVDLCSDISNTTSETTNNETIDRTNVVQVYPDSIRGCEEISPQWFHCWNNIPLHQMFADDSIWLPILLSQPVGKVKFDGWFHFFKGGAETNSIMHHFIHFHVHTSPKLLANEGNHNGANIDTNNNSRKFTLEQRLFHTLHQKDNRGLYPSRNSKNVGNLSTPYDPSLETIPMIMSWMWQEDTAHLQDYFLF